MSAGELIHRITLQSPPVAQDAAGQPTGAWVDAATIWARRYDLTGREFLAASSTQSNLSAKFKIRHRTGVTDAMRVVHGDDTFKVEAVLDPEGLREWQWLMCSKVT